MDYKAKLEAYINLCTPSFLIKMKTTNDKSYFFKAYKSDYHKDSTVLKFTIADVDPVDEDYERWREINLLTEFGDNFNSLKEVIIPEHKDMYKDIETDGMKVACSVEEKCSGNKLNPPPPPAPTSRLKGLINKHKIGFKRSVPAPSIKEHPPKMPPPSITPAQVTKQTTEELEKEGGEFVDPTSIYEGGRKKKKKRRKKRSRSKKRRNKRKNRTKKN